jgi:hypothetical protein
MGPAYFKLASFLRLSGAVSVENQDKMLNMSDAATVRNAILEKTSETGIDLTRAESAFIVAKWTPQGFLLWSFSDFGAAEARACSTAGTVYVMSANEQHGLMYVNQEKLEFV